MRDKDIKTMSNIIADLSSIVLNLSSLENIFEQDIEEKEKVLFGLKSPGYMFKKNIEECIKKRKNQKKDVKRRYSFIHKFTNSL